MDRSDSEVSRAVKRQEQQQQAQQPPPPPDSGEPLANDTGLSNARSLPTTPTSNPLGPSQPQPQHSYDASPAVAAGGASRADADDPNLPDVLILRHRAETYPLHFRAFSIGEGLLTIGDVRRQAAQATGSTADTCRVTLLYKRRALRDDAAACRDEGLMQNSELTCIVGDQPGRDRSSAIGDDSSDETPQNQALVLPTI